MRALAALAAAWVAGFVACGEPTSILIEVDTTNYTVPDELDLLHMQLRDATGLFAERSFELDPVAGDVAHPGLTLVPGADTPETLELRVLGFLGPTLVSTADPVPLTFAPGQEVTVSVLLPRP